MFSGKRNILLIAIMLGMLAPAYRINAGELRERSESFISDCSIGYQYSNITGNGLTLRKSISKSAEIQPTLMLGVDGEKVVYESGIVEANHKSTVGIGLAYRDSLFEQNISNGSIFTSLTSGWFFGGSGERSDHKRDPQQQGDFLLNKGTLGGGIFATLYAREVGFDLFVGMRYGHSVKNGYSKSNESIETSNYNLGFGAGAGVYYKL